MRGRLSVLATVAGTVLLFVVCGCDRATAPPANAGASNPAQSTPVAPRLAASHDDVVASGPIVVENQVDVSAQREGVITQIVADAGTTVKTGQLLARMDDRQLVAEREAAEARVRSVSYDEKNWEARVKLDQVDLDRAEKMMQSDLITREMLDHARFKLEASRNELERERQDLLNAKAMLQSLDIELEKTQIKAPFSGVVGRRYVRAGQKVALGDRLFWVTATAPLHVKFTLPEAYFGSLKRGDAVSVSPGIAPQQRFAARIIELSPVIDPASGTFELTAEITGKTGELRPGMSANVRIPH